MRKRKLIISLISISTLLLSTMTVGCNGSNPAASLLEKYNNWANPQQSYEKASIEESFEIKDKDSLYTDEFGGEVLYLTISKDDKKEETWKNLNLHELNWYKENDENPVECDVLVQFGNEEGPTSGCFGYADISANASIKLSGSKASEKQQKSYKIKLKSSSGTVSGASSFVLSKGFTDPYRFTNKLCYDLMSECDDMFSLRTQFVHVYVKDENEGSDSLFVDYGMYTLVESVNKKYLASRDLDKTGELYKINNFDFKRHEDVIVQPTDASYDQDKFEEYLEAKGSEDYTCLINLLDALNDPSSDIDDIIKHYFDEDNLYDWMAFNILMDNKDTDTENFYLYSPTGSDKFYFIPWDYDGALREDYNILKDEDYSAGWEKGIYIYTESELFKRIISNEHSLGKLEEHVDKLHNSVLSAENVSNKAKALAEEVEPKLYTLPDRTYAKVTKENYEILVDKIEQRIDDNFYAFYDSIETPWPFHINDPEMDNENVIITWDEALNIKSGTTYSIELSDSWDFKNNIVNQTGLSETKYNLGNLETGEYFVRIRAYSESGMVQDAYEFYNTEKKTTIHGVVCFYVFDDGSVVVSRF